MSRVDALSMERSDWLEYHHGHIGGSDVAAIMGLSRFSTAYQVWARLLGISEPEDIGDRPRVEWGTRLEGDIIKKFLSVHKDIRPPDMVGPYEQLVYIPEDRPWAMATLDATLKDGKDGELVVFEAKTAHYPTSDDWGPNGSGTDGVPLYYRAQVNHYLAVTGFARAYVAVLIDGYDYREYVIERDEEDIKAVIDAVDTFWNVNVLQKVEPPVVGPDSKLLATVHNRGEGFADGDLSALDLIEKWRAKDEEEKKVRKELDDLAAQVKQVVGDNKGLMFPEGKLTWSRWTTKRLDESRLKKERPEIYEEFAKDRQGQRMSWKDA